IDARTDVFALGAILCEILTGAPPYHDGSKEAIWDMARRGELSHARGQLAASGADPRLVGMAEKCLAVDPQGRPGDAGEVAKLVGEYMLAVQKEDHDREVERHRAEVERHRAEARAERERRRLWTVVLASIAALVIVLAAAIFVGDRWAQAARRR